MRIEQALAGIAELHDLPAVVAALGGEPRWGPIAPATLGRAAERLRLEAAAEVGRTGVLPWLAVSAPDPARAAERLAAARAAHGTPALVLGWRAPAGPLALAVGSGPTALLTLDPGHPDPVALACLRRAAAVRAEGRLATAVALAEALDGRRVDRGFYDAFRATRDRFVEALPARAPLEERRTLALLQLTRVLFLYFVQQKGWLDGRERYLAEAVDTHLRARRSLARALLRPLFFGALARPSAARSARLRRLGRIPFLNGGLFEPHPLERRWPTDLPDELWRSAFDELFERFHFSLDERGCAGAVAPDMLGRVFEGLMAEELRGDTGTFYTPARLVDRVLDAAVASLLSERLGLDQERARVLLRDRDPRAAAALHGCRVLDPAVGSGAFLLGALELFSALDGRPGMRRAHLRDRLFGVDLSATAVRLAELRLWLAALRDDPEGPEAAVTPLPNLDATLRQGDSLIEPAWLGARRPSARCAALLAEARRRYATASGGAKRAAWRALVAAERASATEALGTLVAGARDGVALLIRDARTPDLFGTPRGLDRDARAELARLRRRIRQARRETRRLALEGELGWFDYAGAFGEVFGERGGFDLVVGNPPWVRAERLPRAARERLAERYRWWRGTGRGGFAHRPDLAVAFVERGLELAAPGGVLAMLLPAKLATSGYATAARAALVRQHTLDVVADLTTQDEDPFGAVTYPLALVVRKRGADAGHQVALDLGGRRHVPQEGWGAAPWVLSAPAAARVAERLLATHPPLAELVRIHLGVKSGQNAVYLDPPDGVEPDLLRLAIRGRDIAPFGVRRGARFLWPHDAEGAPLPTLPPGAAAHLAHHRDLLARRADAGRGPWYALHRTRPACAAHRVAWADLARRLTATVLPPRVIPLNSCYLALTRTAESALGLAAFLNSTWADALARLGADPARGGYARYNARAVGRVPCPAALLDDPALVDLAQRQAAGARLEGTLDALVADRLALDARDREALRASR